MAGGAGGGGGESLLGAAKGPAGARRGVVGGIGGGGRVARGGGGGGSLGVAEAGEGEGRGLTDYLAGILAGGLERLEALVAGDGAERLRRLVAHHTVLALVAEHSLEGRHRARDLHLTKRERHLVAEQRARILEAVQERLHRRFAADAAQAEERAEATRHGKRLVQELGAQCLDAHGEGDGRGERGRWPEKRAIERDAGASTGGPSRSLAHAKGARVVSRAATSARQKRSELRPRPREPPTNLG